MAIITKISENKEKQRIYIYIDSIYCCSVRARTWAGMNLKIGSEITCEDLQELESQFWKKTYGVSAWNREKGRIERVQQWFKKYIPQVDVFITGFGADSIKLIPEHPNEHGEPDLSIRFLDTEIIALEVTGTERLRGEGYWIRPDKLSYAKEHRERDVWIALHYREPVEKFIWVKPNNLKNYDFVEQKIQKAIEHYVVFSNSDEEVKQSQEFFDYVTNKISKNNL